MNKASLIPLIEARGFDSEFFNPLNEAIKGYKQQIALLKLQHNEMQKALKVDKYDSRNPIDTYDIEKLMDERIRWYTGAVRRIVGDAFPNVYFDPIEIYEFAKNQKEFDANEIMFYIFETYAIDEDLVTLAQIQEDIKESLPSFHVGKYEYRNPQCVEELAETTKNGLRFFISGHSYSNGDYSPRDRMSNIVKFAEIIIGKVLPSQAKGWDVKGDSFSNDQIKNITHYKNNNLHITFKNEKDKKAFSEALFTEPQALLSTIFNK